MKRFQTPETKATDFRCESAGELLPSTSTIAIYYYYSPASWADTSWFKFSTAKTVCLRLCHLRKLHPDPQFFLNGGPIPVVYRRKNS